MTKYFPTKSELDLESLITCFVTSYKKPSMYCKVNFDSKWWFLFCLSPIPLFLPSLFTLYFPQYMVIAILECLSIISKKKEIYLYLITIFIFILNLEKILAFHKDVIFQITLYPINVVSKHICNWLKQDQFSYLLFVIRVIQSLSLSILSYIGCNFAAFMKI